MRRSASLRLALAAGLLSASSTAAQAQTRTWDFGDTSAPGACTQVQAGGTNNVGNVYGCTAQPLGTTTTLYAQALSTSNLTATGAFSYAAITPQGTSGVGVGSAAEGGQGANANNGQHALDNNTGGGADALFLQFVDGPQVLQQITLGWTGTDADFQLLRWMGAGTVSLGTAGTAASALAAGWQLVSAVNGAGATTYNVNSAGLASSYWLLSAHNPAFGTTAGFTADGTADQFKVRSISASAPVATVPEPSTYALLGTGIAGLAAVARRRRTAA